MKKPKGKTPSLLSQSTGKPYSEVCKKKSNCTRCKADIMMGEACIKIPKISNGFTSPKTHCIECCRLIVEQTKQDLKEVEDMLLSLSNG